ncbi:UDP-N-acetylmuramoylpentapeptide-lysine N(6)-alanyltransferase MurM [Streptococcus porcinus]|uniref:aminoacyltransferase n=1 Tax=Streptococcus porcinus TaxID=1340 RepID=UPI0010CAC8F9|nr:aminoacyltransferase [Streptococcus porcinus]VTS18068.1 UDP-N-acetylmuramoylpentapeptide-lysine N(6)-alanyltransferase MurM [Streptococcus porcinus]
MANRYVIKIGISAEEHDTFVKASKQINLLQSSYWAEVKHHWQHERIGVYHDSQLIASMSLLIKSLPLGLSMIYIPRGPVMDYNNRDLVVFVVNMLKDYAKQKNALVIKCDPALIFKQYKLSDSIRAVRKSGQDAIDAMIDAGAKWSGLTVQMSETIQPRFQANCYLDKDLVETFPKHTKRLMTDARKRGVEVYRAAPSDLTAFAQVVSLTEDRKHISLRDLDYFKQLMTIYGDDAYLHLAKINIPTQLNYLQTELLEVEHNLRFVESHQRKKLRKLNNQKEALLKNISECERFSEKYPQEVVIAGILSIAYGQSMEMLYAGMNDDFKKYYPQYLLYPKVFEDAYHHGISWANMGGIEGDLSDGLTKFKANFDPCIEEYIGEFNIPVSPLYHPFNLFYKCHKRFRFFRHHFPRK